MSLKTAHLLTFDEKEPSVLEVGFEYELHVKRLEEPKIKEVLEKVLKQVCGVVVNITARVLTQAEIVKFKTQKSEQETKQEKKLVDDVMDVFGSELAAE